MECLQTDRKYFSNSIDNTLIQCANTCSKVNNKDARVTALGLVLVFLLLVLNKYVPHC